MTRIQAEPILLVTVMALLRAMPIDQRDRMAPSELAESSLGATKLVVGATGRHLFGRAGHPGVQ